MHFPRSVSALIGDSACRVGRQARTQNTPVGSWREGVGGVRRPCNGVIARLDRAIQYLLVGGYWIARSNRAMTRRWCSVSAINNYIAMAIFPKCRLAFIISNASATCASGNVL